MLRSCKVQRGPSYLEDGGHTNLLNMSDQELLTIGFRPDGLVTWSLRRRAVGRRQSPHWVFWVGPEDPAIDPRICRENPIERGNSSIPSSWSYHQKLPLAIPLRIVLRRMSSMLKVSQHHMSKDSPASDS